MDHIVIYPFSVCIVLKYSELPWPEPQVPQRLRHTGSKCIQEKKSGRRACVPPGDGFRHAITGGMDIIVVIGVGDGIKVGVF